MALAEHALGRLAHHGEGFGQQVVELGAVCNALLEFGRLGLQLRVGQPGNLRLKIVDRLNRLDLALDRPVVGRPEQLLGKRADHAPLPRITAPICRLERLKSAWPIRKPATETRRSEEHTSELQYLMPRSYAAFCFKQ